MMAFRGFFSGALCSAFLWGAVCLLSACGSAVSHSPQDDERLVSRTVHDMTTALSENGLRRQVMHSALVEEHAFAQTPYTEHPLGIDVVGYDSLGMVPASRVDADHALHWTQRDMWQLSGNVLVEGEQGERLYTQQLFWDRKTRKIWSNVDCKFERGSEVFVGVGFDAIDDFSYAAVRNITGFFSIDTEAREPSPPDSTVVSPPAPVRVERPAEPTHAPVIRPVEARPERSVEQAPVPARSPGELRLRERLVSPSASKPVSQ